MVQMLGLCIRRYAAFHVFTLIRSRVKQAIERAGPCPRDINFWADRPDTYDLLVEQAVRSVQKLTPLLYPSVASWPTSTNRFLILIDRSPDNSTQYPLKDDRYFVRVKTEIIRTMLWRRSLVMDYKKALDFFGVTGGQTRIVAGVAFQGIAIRCISGRLPASTQSAMLGVFSRMEQPEQPAENSNVAPHVFQYSPGSYSHVLAMSAEGPRLMRISKKLLQSSHTVIPKICCLHHSC